MKMVPIPYEWNGDVMVPLPRFDAQCTRQFVVGEVYRLDLVEEASSASRNHYFACLSSAWKNLPEDIAPRYPTMDRLRKRALIKCGFADERTFVFDTDADAVRLAGIIQTYDEDAVLQIKGNVVTVHTAQSQSARAMGKERFQESKNRVLDTVSQLIGVDATTLSAQTPGPREYSPQDQE